MDEDDDFTPKDLEILPNKIVHDILQYGITHDSSLQDDSNEYNGPGVSMNMKKYNPKNRKFKKEALSSMNRVASLFVLYITTVAESIAKMNKRSTVFDKDIMQALRQCMFWEVESQISDELEKLENEGSKLNGCDESKIDNNLDNVSDLEIDETESNEDNEMELDEEENELKEDVKEKYLENEQYENNEDRSKENTEEKEELVDDQND